MSHPTDPTELPPSHPSGSSSQIKPSSHSEFVHGAYPAVSVIAYLVAGPLTFGLAGWGLDRLLGTSFLLVVGLLFGMGLAFYVIWLRYGRT